MKNWTKIFLILTCVAISVSLILVNTYAKWQNQKTAAQTVDIPGTEWNPSESYIVFAGLDSANEVVSSSLNYANIISFAVVGYTGTVAELVIPNEITVSYNEVQITGAVTQILAGGSTGFYFQDGVEYTGDFGEIDLKNNQIITSLYIPSSIVNIGNSVFMGCVNLVSIELEASIEQINMGDYAFSDCISLTSVALNGRTIFGIVVYIFYNTPYSLL